MPEDQTLTCVECQREFEFTAGEQTFFAEKGFTPPKRCKPCRDKKRARMETSGSAEVYVVGLGRR